MNRFSGYFDDEYFAGEKSGMSRRARPVVDAGCRMILAVDVSGSMGGTGLPEVLDAMLRELARDYPSLLVTMFRFNDRVDVVCTDTRIGHVPRIQESQIGGNTDLESALKAVIEKAKDYRGLKLKPGMFVLTDCLSYAPVNETSIDLDWVRQRDIPMSLVIFGRELGGLAEEFIDAAGFYDDEYFLIENRDVNAALREAVGRIGKQVGTTLLSEGYRH